VATLPEASFARSTLACALPRLAACEARPDCFTAPSPGAPFGRICIHHDGDVDCPTADYAARFVSYRGIDDGRACSPCIGKVTGTFAPCIGNWFETIACGAGAGNAASQTGQCETPADPTSANLDFARMAPSALPCTQVDGGVPTGEARLADPVTFCCAR
jgi:hypothetical protein